LDAVEQYLSELHEIRSSGEATDETSYYPAIEHLLNALGEKLKPKVRCILTLKNRGAGHPDGGLFERSQFQKLKDTDPIAGQKPARGAIEIKSTADDAWITAATDQVTKYWKEYGQVLVTNYRDFMLLGRDSDGKPVDLGSYRFSKDEKEFWKLTAHPRKAADDHGSRFQDFLKLVLLSPARLADPKDVAWILAFYAREAKARVEARASLPALASVREALEQALGLKFEGEKGEHFFRSSLIQTLFYGVFSAWVLWSKQRPPNSHDRFDWRLAQWSLHVPMIRVLFGQVATPDRLGTLDLVQVLDWTESALNRVDRAEFFSRFQEQEAVQYFYEPFLEAFDPELRKELGVWYTPRKIVKYMVARTHAVLREELNLPDGLADPNVYVLDPACGTGAFLVEVLNTIAATLKEKGEDALIANDVKRASMERVFGFEILPAPFVVSHLQLGTLLQTLGAPLSDDRSERVGVYLTNSLTGWEPPKEPKQRLIFPEMERERELADAVKHHEKILVVIGNPPYNGFAGVAIGEERELSEAYRSTRRAPPPEGQGLNELYVRFYRMAERRIVEQTGKGIVCFISNYSWLDGRSFPGMREHYLDSFAKIWIDNLHGDRIISEYNPDGVTSETVFAIRGKSPGITVGTAIALLSATPAKKSGDEAVVLYRDMHHAHADDRRSALLSSAANPCINSEYTELRPPLSLGLPFKPRTVDDQYLQWPIVADIFPISFPGVKTSRDSFLVDSDRETLNERVAQFFDATLTDEDIGRLFPSVMKSTDRFNARQVRQQLLHRGRTTGRIVRYQYRPFDLRWLYWDPDTKLLDEKRSDYIDQAKYPNVWITAGQRNRKMDFYQPQFTKVLADHHIVESNVAMFPMMIYPTGQKTFGEMGNEDPRSNLSDRAMDYATGRGTAEDVFYHTLATSIPLFMVSRTPVPSGKTGRAYHCQSLVKHCPFHQVPGALSRNSWILTARSRASQQEIFEQS
jgi:hypothetical protein